MTDIPLGLYIYPVLQSADILLYKYELEQATVLVILFIVQNVTTVSMRQKVKLL